MPPRRAPKQSTSKPPPRKPTRKRAASPVSSVSDSASDISKDDIQLGSTQFVPGSHDEDDSYEKLWDARAILDERKTQYLIEWIGIDPDTGKQWEPSWTEKINVTNDLILAWKAKKEIEKSRQVKQKRATAAGHRSGSAAASTSAPKGKRQPAATAQRGRAATSATDSAKSISPAPSRARSTRSASNARGKPPVSGPSTTTRGRSKSPKREPEASTSSRTTRQPARSARHKSRSPELGSPGIFKKPGSSITSSVPDKPLGEWRPKRLMFVELPPVQRGVKRSASAAGLAASDASATKKQTTETRSVSATSSVAIDDGSLPLHDDETLAKRSIKSSPSSASKSNGSRRSEQDDLPMMVDDPAASTKGKTPIRTRMSTASSRQSFSSAADRGMLLEDSSSSSSGDDSSSDSENEVADLVEASPSVTSLKSTTPSKVSSLSESIVEPASHVPASMPGSSKGSPVSPALRAAVTAAPSSKSSTESNKSKGSPVSPTSKVATASHGFGQSTTTAQSNEDEEEEEEEEDESTQRPLYGKHGLLPILSWRGLSSSDGSLGDENNGDEDPGTQVASSSQAPSRPKTYGMLRGRREPPQLLSAPVVWVSHATSVQHLPAPLPDSDSSSDSGEPIPPAAVASTSKKVLSGKAKNREQHARSKKQIYDSDSESESADNGDVPTSEEAQLEAGSSTPRAKTQLIPDSVDSASRRVTFRDPTASVYGSGDDDLHADQNSAAKRYPKGTRPKSESPVKYTDDVPRVKSVLFRRQIEDSIPPVVETSEDTDTEDGREFFRRRTLKEQTPVPPEPVSESESEEEDLVELDENDEAGNDLDAGGDGLMDDVSGSLPTPQSMVDEEEEEDPASGNTPSSSRAQDTQPRLESPLQGKTKALGPVPDVSPSVFKPYLPSTSQTNQDDISDYSPTPDSRRRNSAGEGNHASQSSSIEDPSGTQSKVNAAASSQIQQDTSVGSSQTQSSTQPSQPTTVSEHVRQRGAELAEQERQRRLAAMPARRSVFGIFKSLLGAGQRTQDVPEDAPTSDAVPGEDATDPLPAARPDAMDADQFINWEAIGPLTPEIPLTSQPQQPLHAPHQFGATGNDTAFPAARSAYAQFDIEVNEEIDVAELRSRLADALEQLQTKSVEMAAVVAQLEATRRELELYKNGSSQTAFASTSALPLTVAPAQLVGPTAQLQTQLVDAQLLSEQLTATIAEHEATIASLRQDVEKLQATTRRATDRAAELSVENRALEERNKILSSQATFGVAQARAVGDARAKELQEELARSQATVRLLQEQARATDSVRARAAEHPKLLERIENLRDKIDGQGKQINDIGERNRALQDELYEEKQHATEAAKTFFRCVWFLSPLHRCGEVFPSPEALQEHVVSHVLDGPVSSQKQPDAMDTST